MAWYSWINEPYLTRLIRRFNLSDDPQNPDSLILLKNVQPITNADNLMRELEIVTGTITSGAGAGWSTAYTIPDTDLVELVNYEISRTTGATATTSAIGIADSAGIMSLQGHTAAADAKAVFSQLIPVKKGWDIKFYIATANDGDVFTFHFIVWRSKNWLTA